MPARLLATAIQTVAPAASRDQARPVLCGIYVTADDKQVTFTATDSYRLHHLTIPTSASVVVSGARQGEHPAMVADPLGEGSVDPHAPPPCRPPPSGP